VPEIHDGRCDQKWASNDKKSAKKAWKLISYQASTIAGFTHVVPMLHAVNTEPVEADKVFLPFP